MRRLALLAALVLLSACADDASSSDAAAAGAAGAPAGTAGAGQGGDASGGGSAGQGGGAAGEGGGAAGEGGGPAGEGGKAREPDPVVEKPLQEETRQVVPGPGLPDEYTSKAGISNNNVDVIRHEGRVYLAIRNGEYHYASPNTRMFVFSSIDEQTWQFELEISLQTDVREPRLLSYKGRLFLYFAKLGTNRFAFEPQGMWMTERTGEKQWTDPQLSYLDGKSFIPWRVKVLGDRAYMTGYEDGEHEYDFTGKPVLVHFLTSDDGVTWRGVDPDKPIVTAGGGSETDFTFDDQGDLYAIQRNESGDETGWGAKVCRAKKESLSTWECAHDPKKYDSPLVFAYKGAILLIGRRNVTPDGVFEVEKIDPGETWNAADAVENLARYSSKPKRCSVWQIERSKLEVRFIDDLPSKGDTCFPSVIDDPADLRRKIVYNYSSPIDWPNDPPWNVGQEKETYIYRTPLVFW